MRQTETGRERTKDGSRQREDLRVRSASFGVLRHLLPDATDVQLVCAIERGRTHLRKYIRGDVRVHACFACTSVSLS